MTRKKTLLAFVLLALLAFALTYAVQTRPSPVAQLVISPEGIELAPGESVQLTAAGYTKEGAPVAAEVMEKLDIQWGYQTVDPVIVVDENGYLTAVRPGSANTWATWDNGKKSTRPITVTVSG